MTGKIYLDHAATTPLDPQVIEVMTSVMNENYGNPSSIHALGRQTRILIENARKVIAQTLNASLGEIYFTSSATESNNAVIRSAVKDLKVDRIISTKSEHHCVLNSVISVSSEVEVVFLDLDERGNISLEQLKTLLKEDKKTLVSIMHVNNEIGTMADLKAISTLCDKDHVYLHTDAVQSLGKFPIDTQETKVDFLSGTAHKINGPKGSGFLYIHGDTHLAPIMYGGAQERNMRAGTENLYGIVGLGRTLEIWGEAREQRMNAILEHRERFKKILTDSQKDIKFNGNQEKLFAPHILSVSIPLDEKTPMIMMNLDIAGICASAGSACSSGAEHDSHVLEAIGAPTDRKVVRFSFSYMNTASEIETAAKKFVDII